jgi:hypothetical protein
LEAGASVTRKVGQVVSGSSDHTRINWIDGEWHTDEPRAVIDDIAQAEPEPDLVETLGMYLRAERERRLIGLDQVEAATCIRAAQLRAIEEDRFDDLPAETYARGFVRTYAEQLGLEPEDVVDRFNRQWADTHEAGDADLPAPFERRMVPVDVSARPPGSLALTAAAAVLALSAVIVGVRSFGGNGSAAPAAGHSAAAQHPPATSTPTSPSPTTAQTPPPVPVTAHVVLRATPGACWFEARRGSETGPLLAERTLASGETVRFSGRRIWLRLGDPTSAVLRLNAKPVRLAAVADPVNLLVTPRKVTPL